jgi:hypothetical protein
MNSGTNKELMLRLQEPFDPNDIEWRTQQAGITNGKPWMIVIPYITSRAIQQRLDEVFTPFGWEVAQEETKNLDGFICTLSIFVDGRWIKKQDVAPKTDIEPLKGGASGALKRAGALLGIGRYLYHLEAVFASCVLCNSRANAFHNFAKVTDKSSNQKFGVDWQAPKLPEWALPNMNSDRFDNAIIAAKSLPELKDAFNDAYRWASSFGKTNELKAFEASKQATLDRLEDEARDSVNKNFNDTKEWLDEQIKNLDRVPDNGAIQSLGAHIGSKLTERCAGQFFDKGILIETLQKAVKERTNKLENPHDKD